VLATVAMLVRAPARIARTAPAADISATQPLMQWSPPATLSVCPATAGARVVFPSDSPSHATGQGAVIWSASSACPGGEGARVAVIGASEQPGAASIPHTAAGQKLAPHAPLTASAGPHGQIVIAGASPDTRINGPGSNRLLIQGTAGGPFTPLQAPGGSATPIALTTAYLGDLAVASPPAGLPDRGGLNVHVERFFSHRFVRNVSARTPEHGALQALTLAMDFRSEALAVWAQRGAIYARLVTNKGTVRPLQRLASVGSDPRISALLSDDNRAIVAWAEQRGPQTSVYVDRSAPGVHFSSPQLVERFNDPDGLSSPAASPSLVRLSSESVILAWAGAAAGHWVVHTAPVDLNGVQSVGTFAAPGEDARLAALAAGPDDDALLLWTEPLSTAGGLPDMARQAIFAARGTDAGPGHASFDEPEQVAPPGPVNDPAVALDPSSDRAVAVWQGEAAKIEYSIRSASKGP
jgi:hypothetical protein